MSFDLSELTKPFVMHFDNDFAFHETLEPPTAAAYRTEPLMRSVEFSDALRKAGDYTRMVLQTAEKHLDGTKRYIYVDSKCQYLKAGDAPVDSLYWHIDGCVFVAEDIASKLGFKHLHDVYARSIAKRNPVFMSFLTNDDCATEYCTRPMRIEMPKCIEYYDVVDRLVKSMQPEIVAQPVCQLMTFEARSLHRAVRARKDGWRLWIRITETDCRQQTHEGVDYNTVFR